MLTRAGIPPTRAWCLGYIPCLSCLSICRQVQLPVPRVVWGTWPGRVKPLRTFLNTVITGSASTNSLHYQPGQTSAGKAAKRKSHTCAPPPKSNTACLQHPLFLLGAQLPPLPGSSAPKMTQLFSSQCPACAPGSTLTLATDLRCTLVTGVQNRAEDGHQVV